MPPALALTAGGPAERALPRWRRPLGNILLCLPHAVISLFVLLRHEPWRDETHAWLLARGPATVIDLLAAIREGEVSPPLWHLILRALSFCSDNFLAVSVLHWALAVAAIGLLVWFSPFHWYEKLFISLGYLMLFEYTVIARHYGLSVLCLFAVLAIYARARTACAAQCLVLALLAQTNVFGTILAATLWLVLWAASRHRILLGHAAVILSIGVSCYYLSGQAADTMRHTDLVLPASSWSDTGFILGRSLLRSALQVGMPEFWWPPVLLQEPALAVGLCVISGLLVVAAAPKRGVGGAFFWVAAALLYALYMSIGAAANIRHHGFLTIALLGGLWLERLDAGSLRAGVGRVVRQGAFMVMLAGSMWSGFWMARADVNCVYSRARSVARQLMERARPWDGKVLWATWGSAECEGMLAFLPRDQAEFYSLELGRRYRYLVHGTEWKGADPNGRKGWVEDVVAAFQAELERGGYVHGYLLLPTQPIHMTVNERQLLVPLLEKSPGRLMAKDEHFYLHEIRTAPRFARGGGP
jgi:hypothetical protein